MAEFIIEYGLFFAKVVTGLIAVIIFVGVIAGSKEKEQGKTLKMSKLNDKYSEIRQHVFETVLDKKELKQFEKEKKKQKKGIEKKAKLFVLEFDGDIKATEAEMLKDEVTAIMTIAKPSDEILLRLENAGGMVHEHGFASSQLERLKKANLSLTISVDRVAASGGYMMACIADRIIAAPFAIIGSIGVLAQLPNFHRLLDKMGVDFEQHTAGEFKRTVTMFGENSEKEREKLKLELQQTHTLFRDFVQQHRPKLDIDKVATGEHWYAKQALDLKLIDEVKTSDEFIIEAMDEYDVFEVKMQEKKKLSDKFLGGLLSSLNQLKSQYANSRHESRLYR